MQMEQERIVVPEIARLLSVFIEATTEYAVLILEKILSLLPCLIDSAFQLYCL
jgi:hypothetical protein